MRTTALDPHGSLPPSLFDSEQRYRRLFEAARDGILILDAATGAITDVNPFLVEMLGYSRNEFLAKRLWEVGAFSDVEASKEAFEALQRREYIRYADLPLRAKDGRLVPVEFVSNVYLEGAQKVIQCNIRDISDRKEAQDTLVRNEARFREQSVRDHLTGLYNRRYMEETLRRELLRATRTLGSLGLIMLDLDGFKGINDSLGHAAGDVALREMGHLLLRNVRGEDIPARYGGDEFVIILPDMAKEMAGRRARNLARAAARLEIQYEGQSLGPVTFSAGVSAYPDDGLNSTAILKAADAGLYSAKQKGRGTVVALGSN